MSTGLQASRPARTISHVQLEFLAIGISIAATFIAILSYLEGRGSRRAAERSATAAEDSNYIAKAARDAATRSAEAAEEANLLSREDIGIKRLEVAAIGERRRRTQA